MLFRSSALHAVKRSHHFASKLDPFSCHCGGDQASYSRTISNEKLTLACKNVFSFMGFEHIMSKRRAGEELDLILVMKRACRQMATGLKESVGVSSSAVDSASMSSTPPVNHDTTAGVSAAENLEDSGIEVTPVVDRSLVRIPNMPGFLLNPPKSFPAPKFDLASTDMAISSSETAVHDGGKSEKQTSVDGNCVSSNALNQTENNECKSQDSCAASSVTSPVVCEKETPSVCTGRPSSDAVDGLNSESGQTTPVPVAAGSDTKSKYKMDAKVIKPGDLGNSKASNSGRSKSKNDHTDRNESPKASSSGRSKCRNDHTDKNESKPSGSTTAVGNAENPKCDHSKGKTAKPETKRRTRKRESAQRKEDQTKPLDFTSTTENAAVSKGHVKDHIASDFRPLKKRKQTVLPVSLLNDVVRTVQGNVGSISKQVAASPSEVSIAAVLNPAACNSKKVDPLIADTKDISDRNMTPENQETEDRKSESERSESVLENINQEKRRPESEQTTSSSTPSEQRLGKDSDKPTKTSSTPSEQSLGNASDKPSGIAPAVKEKDRTSDHLLPADSQASETNLQSVMPVNCVNTVSGQKQKAKKKAKKKRKSKCQRKSTEGEWEDVLGVLPDYVPESDSRLNKKAGDKVYNLSALFSGQLLRRQPPPKRGRPNYFFAIQITNPEIKNRFTAVLQSIAEACPKLTPAFVGVDSAHLTLGVMHLADEEAIAKVISVMERFRVAQQNLRLQEKRLQVDDQEQELPPPAGEKTASSPFPTSPTNESAVTTGDPLKDLATDCPDTVVKDPPTAVSTEPVSSPAAAKTDAADPVNTDAADPTEPVPANADDGDAAASVKMDNRDPAVKPERAEPVDTAAGPLETCSAGVEKCDAPGGEKTTGSASVLDVGGLDTFKHEVVFARVMEGPALDQVKIIAEHLKSQVRDLNLSTDTKPLAPHITLMKTSKNSGKLKAAGIRKIDSKLYQEYMDAHFGSNVVTSIQLCSMLKPKKDNYYHIEHEIPITLS